MLSDGSKLYGMTYYGGANNDGTLFSIGTDGTGFTLLHSFKDDDVDNGSDSMGSLVSDGSKLYGMTYYGGTGAYSGGIGTIFSIGADGSGFTIMHSFEGPPDDAGWPKGNSLALDGGILYGMSRYGGNGTTSIYGDGAIFSYALPTPTPTPTPTPIPQAEIVLNGSSFAPGDPFTAIFKLNQSIERPFTAFAVVIMPNGVMLNALTLDRPLQAVVTNMPRLDATDSYPLIDLIIPAGAPLGNYEVVAAFFDPARPITGRADAFLEASGPFSIH